MNIKQSHVGWAVKSIDKSLKVFHLLGYFEKTSICKDEYRKVNLVLLSNGTGEDIELIEPLTEDSPVSDILKKIGPMPYHFCYSLDIAEWNTCMEELKNNGFMLLHAPAEAPLLGNRKVAFVYSKHIGLLEFVLENKQEEI